MNIFNITKISSLNELVKSKIFITGNPDLWEQETYENMWYFTFSRKAEKEITAEQLKKFLEELLLNKEQQLKDEKIKIPVTFYMWFDAMAGHICFNFISGYPRTLPFGCKLNFVEAEEIFQDYLSSQNHGTIPWSEFKDVSDDEKYEEGGDEDLFEQKVFKTCINSSKTL